MAANEEQLLRQFQASASHDALRELLIAHQDRIYNACFQVLGRPEDAEDAAQESLLKLAEGARFARDADAFRGWIYRVSFRVAIDHWRRREATRHRESRSAMNRPVTPPFDDRERLALFEAMDGLDDRDRALLLDHYFEKVPLSDLGERRGVSAVAIWKRIDRAREKLKRALLGAGFVVASARVGEALEASVPAAAPAALVGEAILGKILAGGLAVGATKSSMIPIAVVTLVLLFGISTSGYVLLRSRKPVRPAPATSTVGASAPKASEERMVAPEDARPAVADAIPAAPQNEMLERLRRYRAWHVEWKAFGRTLDSIAPDEVRKRVDEKSNEGRMILEGARKMIFKDSRTFLDFIRDPANEELCEMLIGHALDRLRIREGQIATLEMQDFSELPAALADGIIGLLKTGTPGQKAPLLRYLLFVKGVSEAFKDQFAVLIHDSDPRVQIGAIAALSQKAPLPLPFLEPVRSVYESSTNPAVRRTALEAISRTDTEEVQRWMVSRIERGIDPDLVRSLAQASLASLQAMGGSADDRTLDRHAAALAAAANVRLDGGDGHMWVVLAALNLPANRAIPVLETVVRSSIPNGGFAKAVSTVLDKIRTQGAPPKSLMYEFRSLLSSGK